MKVGLYFGTFNPIHVGHLIIANHMAEFTDLDQVWMVVTPHNPLKKKSTLLDDYTRLELVRLATEDYPNLKPTDIEFKLPQPNYTINTLAHLEEKFPNHEFSLIMGQDNIESIHKWKNYQVILERYPILVYPRIPSGNEPMDNHTIEGRKIDWVDAPVVEISSTFIRNSIKEKKFVKALLPEKVWEYIDHNNLYRK
ncbi:nicotinate (nicotinamide) nucleotide adenylyltransferase [Flavobacterium selenitireducens]|uniref:nicotinate (nicotinamide) nucleotide adenylyltransferase n=1 Tax=Flavobacterium selenitireducens TaxID=2722704 RepID=UPI00168A97EF|nr:nicotinate-nucleotide adenylyltransferase [Flavobacterium selenitireducens]